MSRETEPYVLYGSYASYYTAKTRSLLRKKGIPFVERLPSALLPLPGCREDISCQRVRHGLLQYPGRRQRPDGIQYHRLGRRRLYGAADKGTTVAEWTGKVAMG